MAFVTFPVLLADLVLQYLDVRYGEAVFGDADAIWRTVSWFFSQPQIYVLPCRRSGSQPTRWPHSGAPASSRTT